MTDVWKTKQSELCLGRVGPLALVVGGQSWTDAGWREYCDLYTEMVVALGPADVILNLSPHFAPTSTQRKLLVEGYFSRHGLSRLRRFALMSDSAVVRGVVTVFGWLGPSHLKLSAYRPSQAVEALEWLHRDASFDVASAVAKLGEMMDLVGHERSILPPTFWQAISARRAEKAIGPDPRP